MDAKEALRQSIIIWRERPTDKEVAIIKLVREGKLPAEAINYRSLCPLCEAFGMNSCEGCPWPGTTRIRCQHEGAYGVWAKDTTPENADKVLAVLEKAYVDLDLVALAQKFKVGDRVKLVKIGKGPHCYARRDCARNPLWDGEHGRVAGVVKHIDSDGSYSVEWDNGKSNGYDDCHLAELTEKFIEKKFKIGDRVKLVSMKRGPNYTPFSDAYDNPLWNGGQGRIAGTVSKIRDNDGLCVDWDNDHWNNYDDCHLAELTEEDKNPLLGAKAGDRFLYEEKELILVSDGDDDPEWFFLVDTTTWMQVCESFLRDDDGSAKGTEQGYDIDVRKLVRK